MTLLNILLPLITLIVGGGASWLIFFKKEKRRIEASTKGVELKTEKLAYDFHSKELQEAYEKIIEMQKIVDEEREKWVSLSKQLSEMKMKLLQEEERRELAEFNVCTVKFCEKRVPPRILE